MLDFCWGCVYGISLWCSVSCSSIFVKHGYILLCKIIETENVMFLNNIICWAITSKIKSKTLNGFTFEKYGRNIIFFLMFWTRIDKKSGYNIRYQVQNFKWLQFWKIWQEHKSFFFFFLMFWAWIDKKSAVLRVEWYKFCK